MSLAARPKTFGQQLNIFLTNKGSFIQKDTILHENDKLINDQQEVCNNFNDFFVSVAKNIGENYIPINEEYPSLMKIKEHLTVQSDLQFKPVDEEFVNKQIG